MTELSTTNITDRCFTPIDENIKFHLPQKIKNLITRKLHYELPYVVLLHLLLTQYNYMSGKVKTNVAS
jgi:hypothetical protein